MPLKSLAQQVREDYLRRREQLSLMPFEVIIEVPRDRWDEFDAWLVENVASPVVIHLPATSKALKVKVSLLTSSDAVLLKLTWGGKQ